MSNNHGLYYSNLFCFFILDYYKQKTLSALTPIQQIICNFLFFNNCTTKLGIVETVYVTLQERK